MKTSTILLLAALAVSAGGNLWQADKALRQQRAHTTQLHQITSQMAVAASAVALAEARMRVMTLQMQRVTETLNEIADEKEAARAARAQLQSAPAKPRKIY